MRAELVGARSDRERLVPGRSAHCIPLRNAMSGPVRLPGQPIDACVAPCTCGNGLPSGWRQRGQRRNVRLWIWRQREERCRHIHRRRISRSVQILYLFRPATAAPTVTANALAVRPGPIAPQAARPCRMTRFHHGIPCQTCRGTEQEVESRRGAVSLARPVSPPRSSNRTCGFPASGFPTGFTTYSRHGVFPPQVSQSRHTKLAEHRFHAERPDASRGHLMTPDQEVSHTVI